MQKILRFHKIHTKKFKIIHLSFKQAIHSDLAYIQQLTEKQKLIYLSVSCQVSFFKNQLIMLRSKILHDAKASFVDAVSQCIDFTCKEVVGDDGQG